MDTLTQQVRDGIAANGFSFIQAPDMQALLGAAGLADWDGFSSSWDDLGLDLYMADGGRYRRCRLRESVAVVQNGAMTDPRGINVQRTFGG